MTKEIQQETIRGIALRAKALGGRAMLVGGCVRDALTGRQSADIDCEVYGLAPQALRSLAAEFGEVDESGARYGIFSLKGAGIDLAVPRLERRTGPKHGDFDVQLDPALPFARAAARRDFTVNAILRDALTGEIVDPFGGQADLRRGVLRAVPGDGFAEDPLRVLRGAQFAARFRLSPDEKTLEKMRMMKTDALSPARVLGEMKKAMASDAPDVFFDVLRRADALRPWFGELAALIGVPQPPRYHPEGDAYTHSMRVLHAAAQKKARALRPEAFVFAALTHDLGKAVDHEMEGTHVALGVEFCRKYREKEDIIHAIQAHHNDVECKTLVACLVQAADAISAARPGARRENLENYIKRLEKLEEITGSYPGVEKSYAIQAGREVRVMVKPEQVSEDQMVILARELAKRIENELEYPGQIKVHVLRETKVVEYAK